MTKPVVVVEDKVRTVMVRFIPYGAEHITLHLKDDGTLIKNYSLPDVAEPSLYDYTSKIAQACYEDWEKHLKYAFAEQPLRKMENAKGYHLIGKLIDLNSFQSKSKYLKHRDKEVEAPLSKFMLNVYLSTDENPCDATFSRIGTTLGDICFESTKPVAWSNEI